MRRQSQEVNLYLDVIPSIDGEQWKKEFDPCQDDLKEVPLLSENMGAIETKFFKGMEADRAALKISDLGCAAKCHGKILAVRQPYEINHPNSKSIDGGLAACQGHPTVCSGAGYGTMDLTMDVGGVDMCEDGVRAIHE